MKVELLEYTTDPEAVVAWAGRVCYSSLPIGDIKEKLTNEEVVKMIDKLFSSGHESPFEHITFTFGIEGISRACSHQLVRSRIASHSQRSQRYVKEKQFEYVVPKTVEDKGLREVFEQRMALMQEWYQEAVNAGIPAEDARFYLPNAAQTQIMTTMNARELFNFLGHRLCSRAQWEIREMATLMLIELRKVAPLIFNRVGPNCFSVNCPEGSMTCGKQSEMREKFKV